LDYVWTTAAGGYCAPRSCRLALPLDRSDEPELSSIARRILDAIVFANPTKGHTGEDWPAHALNWLRTSPLHEAARKGDVPEAKKLLGAGADLTARDEHLRSTPLAWAAKFVSSRCSSPCSDTARRRPCPTTRNGPRHSRGQPNAGTMRSRDFSPRPGVAGAAGAGPGDPRLQLASASLYGNVVEILVEILEVAYQSGQLSQLAHQCVTRVKFGGMPRPIAAILEYSPAQRNGRSEPDLRASLLAHRSASKFRVELSPFRARR
jgi:hypothetical protein